MSAGRTLATVVSPTFNRRSAVLRLLAALERQSISRDCYEVIVSVDGSTDGTTESLRSFHSSGPFQVLSGPNSGRAAACNKGLRAASGDIIVLIDDDMEPCPHFLEAHIAAHQREASLGVMGAVPVSIDDSTSPAARYIGRKFNHHQSLLASPDHELHFRDFYTGNFSISRELLLATGGFDEDFRLYGNEDLELSIRLRMLGAKFVYSADALAVQHYEKDFAALAMDNRSKGKTAVLLASKHPESVPYLRLAGYREGRLRSRAFRAALLNATWRWPATSNRVIAAMQWLEQRRSRLFETLCSPVLDYLFWLGAFEAQNRKGASGA